MWGVEIFTYIYVYVRMKVRSVAVHRLYMCLSNYMYACINCCTYMSPRAFVHEQANTCLPIILGGPVGLVIG